MHTWHCFLTQRILNPITFGSVALHLRLMCPVWGKRLVNMHQRWTKQVNWMDPRKWIQLKMVILTLIWHIKKKGAKWRKHQGGIYFLAHVPSYYQAGCPPLRRLYVAACHFANIQRTKNWKENASNFLLNLSFFLKNLFKDFHLLSKSNTFPPVAQKEWATKVLVIYLDDYDISDTFHHIITVLEI